MGYALKLIFRSREEVTIGVYHPPATRAGEGYGLLRPVTYGFEHSSILLQKPKHQWV